MSPLNPRPAHNLEESDVSRTSEHRSLTPSPDGIVPALLLLLCLGMPGMAAASECDRAARMDAEAKAMADPAAKAATLEKALTLCPDGNIAYRLAVIRLQELRDPKGAIRALDQAQKTVDPSKRSSGALLAAIEGRRAQALHGLGDIPGALSHIEGAFSYPESKNLSWLWQVRKAIDLHPRRSSMTQADITRSLATNRAIGISPRIDLYILFDTNQEQPNPEGMSQARELGKVLASMAGDFEQALIIGHTDRRASDEYNMDLSIRRAETVVELLQQWHPELTDKLKPKGKGEAQPKYEGDSEEDYRLNRRVEVQLL